MSFDDFYKIYPKKVEKLYARKCYDIAIRNGATHEEIYNGAKTYAAYCLAENKDRQYIKNPSTFLNKGCWMDEYEIVAHVTVSPEESRHRARVAAYNATGRWLDEWGEKPKNSNSNVVDLFSRIA